MKRYIKVKKIKLKYRHTTELLLIRHIHTHQMLPELSLSPKALNEPSLRRNMFISRSLPDE